ncbi:hypothetical protein [Burkholderia pseudomallei]|uniref:hypothetical protein n=1 Tax=Burkholderia pseudomallei TaxID=28450 RepID=UPI000538FC05|nr:hypothetical protein [Burkholderia pseudomallei]AJX21114.1 hypothetical protein BG17_1355 [Burkholderia pseudomallei MSHR491]KGW82964.1 hypothetical protein Y034_796 [Burkholderia pseudomallei MSHR449]KGX74496.1 hypothetical protein Y033_661 [Burkholderia pseudomallei MSHR435]
MKTASIALTRACVIGGDWNGQHVDGYNEFRDSKTYRDFDTFACLFRMLVKEFPYVHYDDEPGHVVRIHDDTVLMEYDTNGKLAARQGLKVLRLETPDDGTLLGWYDELKAAVEA